MDTTEKIKALLASRATDTDALGLRLCSVNLRRWVGGATCMYPPHFFAVDDDFYRLFPDEKDVWSFVNHPAVLWRSTDKKARISLDVIEGARPSEVIKNIELLYDQLWREISKEVGIDVVTAEMRSRIVAESIMGIVGPYFGEIYGKNS